MDEEAARDRLDDAGQVQSSRRNSASLGDPIKAKPEEPEVAGSGWAAGGDWDDDWDDDDDWGDDEDSEIDMEERRQTQDKQHLVSEIREAMTSVAQQPVAEPVQAAAPAPAPARPRTDRGEWADDDELGRQARARSQLTEATDENEDRLMEKTETVMSDRESSRRRSAMAHMKAAAAATKADRVLRHVAAQDPTADPAEQSPYRDDLAKVVRPHSSSRPISRQVSRTDAPAAVWDQGVGDEDAALYAAAEGGMTEDPALSIDNEMSAAEELRLSRAPKELSEEDFAEDEFETPTPRAAQDFPSSRFAVPLEEAEGEHNAFDDVAEDIASVARHGDDFEDPFADEVEEDHFEETVEDDDAPQPSSVVAEAVAFANAPDEEPEPQPEAEVRKKIWEMADEVAAEVETSREAVRPEPEPAPAPEPSAAPADNMLDVSAAVAGRAGRSAGRVKTRLLGFQAEDEQKDVFAGAGTEGRTPVVADKFPTGWIVVIEGPGRGASFSVHAGVSQIGRGEDQTVRLDFGDTSISRNNHAAVAFDTEQSKFFLGHGGKSNLVRLNGKPVLSTEELANGDEIRIGETLLKFVAFCNDDFSWTSGGDEAANA